MTEAVRPAELSTHFDSMAGDYLVSVYAEAGLADRASWRGQPLGIAPPDALEIAAILYESRPQRVVAVNLSPGLLRFVIDMLARNDDASRIVVVGEGGIGGSVEADPLDPLCLRAVRHALGAATRTMVLYAPRKQDHLPLDLLHAYADFVSLRSFLVVVGSAHSQPWLGYARAWLMMTINSFVGSAPFAIDHTRTQHLITSCPLGFLQRIGALAPKTGEVAGEQALVVS